MTPLSLVALALAMIGLACGQERVLNIFLEKKATPSFSFSGSALATDFEILELPQTRPLKKTSPFSFKGETIWKISPPERMKVDEWPGITYGDLPNGFSQSMPEHGAPPKLAEGKLYVARIVESKDSQSVLFFEIRRGRAVDVSDEVLGP